jgi:hypothetical protein
VQTAKYDIPRVIRSISVVAVSSNAAETWRLRKPFGNTRHRTATPHCTRQVMAIYLISATISIYIHLPYLMNAECRFLIDQIPTNFHKPPAGAFHIQ